MSGYNGVRSIGARPSVRTLEALRDITEAVIKLCRNYREVAVQAVKSGSMRVYVPADLNERTIDQFFRNAATLVSNGNLTGEPCYESVAAGNNGRNEDQTIHNGYLVVDVIERLVIDCVGRDGKTKLTTPLVRFATTEQVVP